MPAPHVTPATRQPQESESLFSVKRPWWRSLVLILLLLLSVALYVMLINVAAPENTLLFAPFLQTWMVCFVPYFAACALVLATKPAPGRWRWIELGIIFVGALVFRVMLLPLPPNLSHDSWRYLWDARVTLRGYSPYVYLPWDKTFLSLRDFIYENSRYRNVPTLYPPGAQAVFLLSYLLAPSNLFFLKGIFIVFDMLTCGALALLLRQKNSDPRRAIIYAWCPLPIVEFALQGHVDVITITFTILAVLCATATWRGSRAVTGFLIGMATLTKIYPIILLVVIMRRRDWALLTTCFATILVGYIAETILQEHIVDVIVICGTSLVVLALRLWKVSMEVTTLLMIGAILAISSHVFPWYATAFLPWIAMLIGPLWTRRRLSVKGLAILMTWYFTTATLSGYFFSNTRDWHVYYVFVYDATLLGLGIALIVGLWGWVKHVHRMPVEEKLE